MLKSGLEKIVLKSLHAANYFIKGRFLSKITNSVTESTFFRIEGFQKKYIKKSRPLFTIIFRPKIWTMEAMYEFLIVCVKLQGAYHHHQTDDLQE